MHTYPNVSCLIFSSWYELLNKPSMLFDPGLLNMSQIVQSKELTGFYHLRHCYNCYNCLFYLPSNCANSSLIASFTRSWGIAWDVCFSYMYFVLYLLVSLNFLVFFGLVLGPSWVLGLVGIGAEVVDCVTFSSLKSDLASRRLLKSNVNPGGNLKNHEND